MKNKWKLLFNPFKYVAGWKAFVIGLVILCLTTVTGYFGNTVFYALEIKVVPHLTFAMAASLQCLGLVVTILVMYLAALFFARHTRFQDIAGTITLAKYPLLLAALFSLLFANQLTSIDVMKIMTNELTPSDYAIMGISSICMLLLLIWEIVLLYNAFCVSTNLKGVRCLVVFTVAMIITEIITLIAASFMMKKFFITVALAAAIATPAVAQENYKQVNDIACQVAEALQKADYKTVVPHFDSAMTNALPEAKVEELMQQLIAQFGKFEEVKRTETSNADVEKYKGVFIPCKFEEAEILLQLFFNADNKISGLYIKPKG